MAAAAASRKLRFEVVYVSGEDPDYPASELNVHSPQTKGWATPRFGDFPAELGLRFQSAPIRIQQVQILSHQTKIATRIELFVGRGDDYFSAQWKRLGYLSLDSNERSEYKARELKSVYIDAAGHFLRLMIHKCHVNTRNLFNQVGIVAINILGDTLDPSRPLPSMESPGLPRASAGKRADGSSSSSSASGSASSAPAGAGPDDLAVDMGLDPETAELYRDIHRRKVVAVQNEDFALAKALKEAEELVRALGGRMAVLAEEKRRAIADEDYDRAAAVKAQIDGMRAELLARADPTSVRRSAAPSSMAPGMGPARFAGGPPSSSGMDGAYWAAPGRGGAAFPAESFGDPSRMMMMMGGGGGGGSGGSGGGRGTVPAGYGGLGLPQRNPGAGISSDPDDRYSDAGFAPAPAPMSSVGDPDPYLDEIVSPPRRGGAADAPRSQQPPPAARRAAMGHPDPDSEPAQPIRVRGADRGAPRSDEDRPIRPAAEGAEVYERAAVTDPTATAAPRSTVAAGRADDESRGGPSSGVGASSHADASQLPGVPDAAELPAPEPLTSAAAQRLGEVIDVCGEYIAQCLASSAWQLREAALLQMTWQCESRDDPPPVVSMRALCNAVAGAVAGDRIAQVVVAACKCVAKATSTVSLSVDAAELARAVEPAARSFVDHMADNGAKIREAAVQALLSLAACESIGPAFIARLCMEPVPPKLASRPKTLPTRLSLLASLVSDHALLDDGVSAAELMRYLVDLGAHENKSGEIRDAARRLATDLYRLIGNSIERYMGHLNEKQKEEYREAFAKAGGAPLAPTGAGSARGAGPQPAPSSVRGPAPASGRGGASTGAGRGRADDASGPMRAARGGVSGSSRGGASSVGGGRGAGGRGAGPAGAGRGGRAPAGGRSGAAAAAAALPDDDDYFGGLGGEDDDIDGLDVDLDDLAVDGGGRGRGGGGRGTVPAPRNGVGAGIGNGGGGGGGRRMAEPMMVDDTADDFFDDGGLEDFDDVAPVRSGRRA